MKSYFEHVGEEEYVKQEHEFFKDSVIFARPDTNWYWLRQKGVMASYWQMCFNEQERAFREAEGYKMMYFKHTRVWLYNDVNTLKMFEGAGKGYKD